MQRSQHLSWVFLNNKNNRMFFVSALVIIFLIALPFLLFELYTQTRGLLNLTALDKRVVTPENVQTTLKEVDDYLSSYSLNTSILQTQLEAFNQIPNPDIYLQERKLHLIKLILQRTWFPDSAIYQEIAKIYFDLGYYESSIYYLNFVKLDALSSPEEQIGILDMQYKLYTFLGDFKNATLTAIKMLELLPNNYDWTYALAQSYIKSGEYIAARNVLEKLVSDNGNHPLYLQAMFTLLDVLKNLNLESKIDFYYRYLVTVFVERGEEDIFLSGYAKHLVKETSPAVAAEVWKVPYGIIKDKKTINKNLKNNFAKYLKL